MDPYVNEMRTELVDLRACRRHHRRTPRTSASADVDTPPRLFQSNHVPPHRRELSALSEWGGFFRVLEYGLFQYWRGISHRI